MPWTEYESRCAPDLTTILRANFWRLCCVCLALLVAIPLLAQEKRLSVYAPQMYYQVAVSDHGGTEYAGLLDVLEPLGRVEARADGKKWKLRFTGTGTTIEAEFEDGKKKTKIRGNELQLPANFLLQGDRGYVPIASLANLLPRLLERTVELHASRRIFVGGSGVKLTLELKHNPNRLVATFPAAVSPQVATDGNHVRLTFSRDPVVSPATDSATYTDAPFASSSFSESNGNAVLDVMGTTPLQATFSDGGKTLTIAAVAQQAATPSPNPQQPSPSAPGAPATATESPSAPKPAKRTYFVALDAGHGGDERGAQLTETLNEKDVTFALAKRIQHELENRGIAVYVIRGGDATLTADQRAASANGSRAGLYISVHAATLGTGVRVFTAMVPPTTIAGRRTFLPWDTAQAAYVANSSTAATAIVTEFGNRKIQARALSAPVRPLNNIASAAVAVEIAPKTDSVESITDVKYQQDVASAIATAVANIRAKLEAQ